MAKNFNGVSTELNEDKALLRLNMHILITRYLEKRAFRFIKFIEDNEETIENGGEAETVSNLEKKTKKGFI